MVNDDFQHMVNYIKESMDGSHVRQTAQFLCVLRDATKVLQDFLDLHIGYAEDSADSIAVLISKLRERKADNGTDPKTG